MPASSSLPAKFRWTASVCKNAFIIVGLIVFGPHIFKYAPQVNKAYFVFGGYIADDITVCIEYLIEFIGIVFLFTDHT